MFIKGTLDTPKCKFTRRLVESLKPFEYRNIKTFNILEDERIRQWLKFYTNWPTFPQVFIEAKFVGGIDVVSELIEEGEFDEMLPEACKKLSPAAALDEIFANFEVVAFISKPDDKKLLEILEAQGVKYLSVDLKVKTDFAAELAEREPKVSGASNSLFVSGKLVGSSDEVVKIQEAGELEKLLPAIKKAETLEERLVRIINQHKIMLFMKGKPESPECGFSKRIVAVLEKYAGSIIPSYGHFNIFEDNDVREGLKTYSKWPTFPQLYVNGTLIGGIDIV